MNNMIRVLVVASIALLCRTASADSVRSLADGYLGYLGYEPASPLVGFAQDEPKLIERVGNIAYVANRGAGVRIYDLSDPENMVILGRFETASAALDVKFSDRTGVPLLYIASNTEGVEIVDVSDPANPVPVSAITGITAREIEVFDDVNGVASLIVRTGFDLQFFDISNPASPSLEHTVPGFNLSGRLQVQEVGSRRYLYYLTSLDVIEIYLIQANYQLFLLETVIPADDVDGFIVEGDMLYAALADRSLDVITMQGDRIGWSVEENLELPFPGIEMSIENQRLFVIDRFASQFVAFDLTNPDAPDLYADVQTHGRALAITAIGDTVYSFDELVTTSMDISDPAVFQTDPVLGSIGLSTAIPAGEIHVDNGRAVADRDDELYLFDVSTNTPVLLADTSGFQWNIRGFDLVGDMCYVLDDDILRIVDLSSDQFVHVGSFTLRTWLPVRSQDVCVLNGVAHVAMGLVGLKRVDVSNPSSPSEIVGGPSYPNLLQIERTFAIDGGPYVFYRADNHIAVPFPYSEYDGNDIRIDRDGYSYFFFADGWGPEVAVFAPDTVDDPFNAEPIAIHSAIQNFPYTNDYTVGIAFGDDLMLAEHTNSGVAIFNLGDRLSLDFAGVVDGFGVIYGIASDGDRLFLNARTQIVVLDIGTPAACAADLTGDGSLDFFDVSAFLAAFVAMDPIADFTGDGAFNFFDVSAFLSAFGAGCP
ncbi:MAG: GC-type dockerin domain-anchored protein [Phycisphaerales bacterium]